jgi:hypothetical protein
MKPTVRAHTPPGFVTPGATQIKGARVASSHRGEFSPMLFFAQVPAVVAPQHDNRVVAILALAERVDKAADHGVGIRDCRQVPLHGFLPAARFDHRAMIAVGLGHLDARRRNVGQVIGLNFQSSSFSYTPEEKGRRPDMSEARDGLQTGAAQ